MKNYIMILLSIILMSCEDTNSSLIESDNFNACGVSSFRQLNWAQDLVAGKGACSQIYSGAKLTMYDYMGEKVFYFENLASSIGSCNRGLYNCSGMILISANSEQSIWTDFENNRSSGKLIWSK